MSKKKIVQWYIYPNHFKYSAATQKNIPIANYWPWKNIKTINDQTVQKINKKINENKIPYSHYIFPVLHECFTWQDFNDTEIRYITNSAHVERYSELDINVFIFHFRHQQDEIFTNPEYWPLENTHPLAIKFLQKNRSCYIIFYDIMEAKAAYADGWTSVPALEIMRKKYDLKNNFIWANAQMNPSVIEKSSTRNLPRWLKFCGSNHWLEFVHYRNKIISDTNSTKVKTYPVEYHLQTPNMDKGRFLFYAGRFRIARFSILSKLINELPSEQLYFSAHAPDLVSKKDRKFVTKSMINHYKRMSQDINYDYGNSYTEEDIKMLEDLESQLPLNSFPKNLQEGKSRKFGEDKKTYERYKNIYIPNEEHYKNIFIDISCETFNERMGLYPNVLLASEKIAKPLWACRPFICSANAGFYKELKALGFKTFDNWWDESFDEDVDIATHIKRIVKVIKEISSWSDKKCLEVFEEMKPTLAHNRQVLEDICFTRERSFFKNLRFLDSNPHLQFQT